MTANEIIKALGECPRHAICENCPFEKDGCDLGMLCEEAAELINRQQAEIERLKENNKCTFPHGVTVKPDGVNELDPCQYDEIERYKNVTVNILRCPKCGHTEIEWERQEDTICLT